VKVRIYFCKEPNDIQRGRLNRIALVTIYDLVWEAEFKNLITIGKLWLKVNGKVEPFGIPLKHKRHHKSLLPGDIIEMNNEFYMVMDVGVKKIVLA
jgi:hypothetical protein